MPIGPPRAVPPAPRLPPAGPTTCSRRLTLLPRARPREFSRAARTPPRRSSRFHFAELRSRCLPAPNQAPQPLGHSRFSPPASGRRAPHEVLPPTPPPARTLEAGLGRRALIGCLLGAPPLCTRKQWCGPGRARAARPRGLSVRDPRANPCVPARVFARWGRAAAAGHRGLKARMAPEVLSGPGGAPQPDVPRGLGAARGAGTRRGHQPGSPDVSTLCGGAADALIGPGRRLVLKGQPLVRAGGGGASCPGTRPQPLGDAAAPAFGSPLLQVGRNWSAARGAWGWPQMAASRPGFSLAAPRPVAPHGAGRRRPVIGRGPRECRTLSGRCSLCPCPPPPQIKMGAEQGPWTALVPTLLGIPWIVGKYNLKDCGF